MKMTCIALVSAFAVTYAPAFGATFDIDKFTANIVNGLAAEEPTGFALVIRKGGVVVRHGEYGYARKTPIRLMATTVVVPTMSMSKTITAAAWLKFLDSPSANLSGCTASDKLDCLIAPFLPVGWAKGPHINSITFRMLLSHTSGLHDKRGTWSNIAASISEGADDSIQGKVYAYKNINYSLLRVLMAYVANKGAAANQELLGNGAQYTAYFFRNWVKANVFDPVGISQVDLQPVGAQPYLALYNSDESGTYEPPTDGSTILTGGAGSWNLSLENFAKFIDGLARGPILNRTQWTRMRRVFSQEVDAAIGFTYLDGEHGHYPAKGGSFATENGAGGCAMWTRYPNDVTLVWYINSRNDEGQCPIEHGASVLNILAYDQAWVVD